MDDEGTDIDCAGPNPVKEAIEPFGPVAYHDLKILAPATPTRVVGLAKNRRCEKNEPIVFLMTSSSVIAHNETIKIPTDRGPTWSEVEIGIIVSKMAKDISEEDADDYILGYTVANDVTTKNIADRDWHLARGKALDTYCPTGPHLITDLVTDDLRMTTRVNGELKQDTSTNLRKYDETAALSYVSSIMTLEPGDLVVTGTPSSPLDATIEPGDTTTVEIENIGSLSNTVDEIHQ